MLEASVDRIEAALARLIEAQARTDEQLAQLTEAQRRTEERVDKLTAAVDALAEAQRRTEARVDELAQALLQLSARVDALAEAQRRTEERVNALAEAQRRTEERVGALAEAQRRTEVRVGSLQGAALEARYRDRAPAYFSDLLRKIHALSSEELAELLDDAESRGAITPADRRDLIYSDVVVRGLRRDSGELAYLVVEVSVVVDDHDVERALRRAELLARAVKRPAIPVVAGERLAPEAEPLLREQGVWLVLDGRAFSPNEAPAPGRS